MAVYQATWFEFCMILKLYWFEFCMILKLFWDHEIDFSPLTCTPLYFCTFFSLIIKIFFEFCQYFQSFNSQHEHPTSTVLEHVEFGEGSGLAHTCWHGACKSMFFKSRLLKKLNQKSKVTKPMQLWTWLRWHSGIPFQLQLYRLQTLALINSNSCERSF